MVFAVRNGMLLIYYSSWEKNMQNHRKTNIIYLSKTISSTMHYAFSFRQHECGLLVKVSLSPVWKSPGCPLAPWGLCICQRRKQPDDVDTQDSISLTPLGHNHPVSVWLAPEVKVDELKEDAEPLFTRVIRPDLRWNAFTDNSLCLFESFCSAM